MFMKMNMWAGRFSVTPCFISHGTCVAHENSSWENMDLWVNFHRINSQDLTRYQHSQGVRATLPALLDEGNDNFYFSRLGAKTAQTTAPAGREASVATCHFRCISPSSTCSGVSAFTTVANLSSRPSLPHHAQRQRLIQVDMVPSVVDWSHHKRGGGGDAIFASCYCENPMSINANHGSDGDADTVVRPRARPRVPTGFPPRIPREMPTRMQPRMPCQPQRATSTSYGVPTAHPSRMSEPNLRRHR